MELTGLSEIKKILTKNVISQFILLHRQMKQIFSISFNSNSQVMVSEPLQALILVSNWTLALAKTRKFSRLLNKKSVPDQLASFIRQEVVGVSMLLLVSLISFVCF